MHHEFDIMKPEISSAKFPRIMRLHIRLRHVGR